MLNRVRKAAKMASGMGVTGTKWGADFFTGEVITGLLGREGKLPLLLLLFPSEGEGT